LATGLEGNLYDSSWGGSNCTATNGCGVHVHAGTSCTDSVGQGGHLKTANGSDPWTTIRYSSTSASGVAHFVFVVQTDNADISGKPFVVHNDAGARVSCGLLFPAFPVYVATLSELDSSGVAGEVTVFASPGRLLGVGTATGLEANLSATPSGSNCTAKNGCGVHVHSGTGCASSGEQGGHFYASGATDPWTTVRYSGTDAQGVADFSFSVAAGPASIAGKPFIIHNDAGARVACGILSWTNGTQSALLGEFGDSNVTGTATIYATGSMIVGAGTAAGLQADLDDSVNCGASNGCGVHVHSGTQCDNTTIQGGHLKTMSGDDPWTTVRYSSTSSAGFADFVFRVSTDNTGVTGKPFIVHNNEGGRVSCGILQNAMVEELVTTTTTTTTTATTTTTTTTTTTSTTTSTSTSTPMATTTGQAATTMEAPTTTAAMTTPEAAQTFSGSLSFISTALTKDQVATSAKKSLAKEFGIDESRVTITVEETRRLDSLRQLAGTWNVAFSLDVPSSQVAVVEAKVTAIQTDPTTFKTAINQAMKTELQALGVSETDAAISVASVTATKVDSSSTQAPAPPTPPTPPDLGTVNHACSICSPAWALQSLMALLLCLYSL